MPNFISKAYSYQDLCRGGGTMCPPRGFIRPKKPGATRVKHKNYNFDKRSLLCWEKALGDVSCNVFAKFIYMRHIPSVHIFSTNFSLRMFLVCYFSSIFQPSCSYKVCSYKKTCMLAMGEHIYLQKK